MKLFHKRRNKIIALALSAVSLIACVSVALAGTLAAPSEITETFTNPYPASYMPVTLDQTRNASIVGAYNWLSNDTSILTVTFNQQDRSQGTVKGEELGHGTITTATLTGLVEVWNYYVRDMNNITKYTVKNGGQGYIPGNGGTLDLIGKGIVTTEPAAATSRITWTSLDTDVATVGATTGVITAKKEIGAAIIVGSFVDPWGVPHDLHFLVMIGSNLNDDLLNKLIEKIREAEKILSDSGSQNKYTEDSLNNLDEATEGGREVVGNYPDVSRDDIQNAINEIDEALDGLQEKGTVVADFYVRNNNTGAPATDYTVYTQSTGYVSNTFTAVVTGSQIRSLAKWDYDDSALYCDDQDVDYEFQFGVIPPLTGSMNNGAETVRMSLPPSCEGTLIIKAWALDDPTKYWEFTITVVKVD